MSLHCRVTPRGDVALEGVAESNAERRIAQAFDEGLGAGVLQLGAGEVHTELEPTLGFFRELGKSFVTAVCGAADPYAPSAAPTPDPPEAELAALAGAVPPMRGAELIDASLLRQVWLATTQALVAAAKAHGGVQDFLRAKSDVWNVVGRVVFHIAENRRDRSHPFAFIATYTRALSARRATPIYVPLGRALEEYAREDDKEKLIALLSPLHRAAEESELIAALVESGDIYHPLSWSPADAHRFLCETPVLERAGLVVRTPDWWNAKQRPRPRVTVSVGNRAPSTLGMSALLSFDVKLTLDGRKLSEAEIDKLLRARDGLVLIRGKWVEVDSESLDAVLRRWREAQQQAEDGGLTMAEAMRMLAGAEVTSGDAIDLDDRPEWSDVVAGKWLSKRLDAVRSPRVQRAIDRGAGLRAELRPYQKVGVAWLATLCDLRLGGCLADDMGLGKTVQVIAMLSLLQKRDASATHLLVVPASLVANWVAELQKFAPHLSALVAHRSSLSRPELLALGADDLDAHDVVITTYGSATRYAALAEHAWGCVVLDEAQAIKNPGAKQTRAIKKLRAEWRLALTGTPVENRLGDLWSIFDFINPGLLGGRKAFNAFCKRMTAQGGYAPLRKLVTPYILRRLKTDKRVIDDLPDKIEITAHCLLSKPQAALYKRSVAELKRILEEVEGRERRGVVLSFLLRFKQICNHPSQWLGDDVYAPADSGKLVRLAELCEPIAARQEKVLVFTQFREMTGRLADHLTSIFEAPGLVLHGGTRVSRRQRLVTQFQEDERIPFMVLSLKAGGTGLNLTAASHVIHFDRWWNPAVEDQATDRAFRIGQKNNVLVHKLVCRGTAEERIDELIAQKRQLASDVLATDASKSITEMSNDELLALVALDVNAATGA